MRYSSAIVDQQQGILAVAIRKRDDFGCCVRHLLCGSGVYSERVFTCGGDEDG
jgi:hypothetical protein